MPRASRRRPPRALTPRSPSSCECQPHAFGFCRAHLLLTLASPFPAVASLSWLKLEMSSGRLILGSVLTHFLCVVVMGYIPTCSGMCSLFYGRDPWKLAAPLPIFNAKSFSLKSTVEFYLFLCQIIVKLLCRYKRRSIIDFIALLMAVCSQLE